jgi:4-hydroxybenzoyl-CoA thioesterase
MTAMFSNTRHLRIEWGDCDPAGIVFYPRYFAMFDTSTTEMMEAAIGMSKFEYLKAFKFIGHPIVETRAIFRIPNRFGDRVAIETSVAGLGKSSIKIEHRLMKAGEVSVEGFETRVFVAPDPADPERMKGQPIPPEFVARLAHGK